METRPMIAPVISQQQANKRAIAQVQTASVPSPVGGLNARDSLANMPTTDALILDNWFPTPSDIMLRNGYSNWATGLPGWVESLMPYNGLTAVRKLFAASVNGGGASIYDVTTQGTVGTAKVTGLTNARFQWTNFATAGATYLYGVNGQDNPVLYNGTTWQQVGSATSPIAITGTDSSKFIQVVPYQQRLYFIPVNSTGFWYLAAASIGGAASFFDLGPLLNLGGYIVGMVDWTINNAAGIQEYACFVSSEGEVLMYQGFDPNTSATWGLVARFRIGRPIGNRFICKSGSDVLLLTVDGVVPLSASLLTDRSSINIAVSDKIRNLIRNDLANYNANFGWQLKLFPAGTKLIVNVPVSPDSQMYQYVMNTITGAWCSFGKINNPWLAACFEILEDNLFFGGNGYVGWADQGQEDNNGSIQAVGKGAFNYFGIKGQNKMFTFMRPVFIAGGSLQASIDINVDFEDVPPTSTPSTSAGTGTPWGSPWGSPWSTALTIVQQWDTPNAIGFCAAPYVIVKAANLGVNWEATDFVFQPGGVL